MKSVFKNQRNSAYFTPIYKQPKFDLFTITNIRTFNLPKPTQFHTPLLWLKNTLNLRQNIKQTIPWAKSIILVGLNYASKPIPEQFNKKYLVISDYARLRDYHKVLKAKLQNVIKIIQDSLNLYALQHGSRNNSQYDSRYNLRYNSQYKSQLKQLHKMHLKYKIFVDSFPIYEKGYALASFPNTTLGKNGLIQTAIGSKIVIGGVVLNINVSVAQNLLIGLDNSTSQDFSKFLYIESRYKQDRQTSTNAKNTSLQNTNSQSINSQNINANQNSYTKHTNKQIKNMCKNCNKCIANCPTGALQGFKIVHAKCISYLTVEAKGKIPDFLQKRMKNWLFGCDECQSTKTCPFNNTFEKTLTNPQLTLRFGKTIPKVLYFRQAQRISFHGFYKYFKSTPVIRMRYIKFKDRVEWYGRNVYTTHP